MFKMCSRFGSRLVRYGKAILRKRNRKKKARERRKSLQQSKVKMLGDQSWELLHFGLMEKKSKTTSDATLEDEGEQDVDCRDLFCGDHGDREKYLLTWNELFCFSMCTRFNVSYVFGQMEMMSNFGPELTILITTLIMVFTGIPILSAYIFLGHFAKRYFVKFWDFVPILKGLPFALIMQAIPIQVFNMYFATLCLVYIGFLIKNRQIPWTNCNFNYETVTCIPMYSSHGNITTNCCDMVLEKNCTFKKNVVQVPKYSTLAYFITVRKFNSHHTIRDISERAIFWFCLYIVVFIFMLIGMKRFRRLLTRFIMLSAIVMIPIITGTIIYGAYIPAPERDYTVMDKFLMADFWSAIASNSIAMETPMEMVNFGAQSPVTTAPTSASVLLYVAIEIVILLITVWMCISYRKVQSHYKILDARCLILRALIWFICFYYSYMFRPKAIFRGQIYVFVLIPDQLSRWYLGYQLIIIYFCFLFIWWMIGIIIKCTSIVDALAGQFPTLRMYRTLVSALLCCCMFVYTVYLTHGDVIEENYEKLSTQTPIITYSLLTTTALGVYIYSPERIAKDYQFVHQVRVHNFFTYGIKLYIGTALIMWATLYLPHQREESVLMQLIVLLPIALGGFCVTFQYFCGLRPTIIEPDHNWGPKSGVVREERAWYDSTHHFVFDTSKMLCKHGCAATSSRLPLTIKTWENRQLAYEATLKNVSDDKEAM